VPPGKKRKKKYIYIYIYQVWYTLVIPAAGKEREEDRGQCHLSQYWGLNSGPTP
jgi:hypothetical protein